MRFVSLGFVQDRLQTRAHQRMNWTDPAAIAAYIGVSSTGALALILRMRKIWVRDNRDVTYDTEQTKWVEGLQSEIRQLREEKDRMFAQRLQDVVAIAEAKAMNEFLQKELHRMREMVSGMETSMRSMKARLAAIDNTLQTTDFHPLHTHKD
jgi:ElaB/YqjD/DUF883 family membrane-anchored ribosome-binding protein